MGGKAKPGVIDVVEAAYRVDDGSTWLRGVAETLRPLIDRGGGLGAFTYDLRDPSGFRVSRPIVLGGVPEWEAEVPRINATLSPESAARLYGPGGPSLALVSEKLRRAVMPAEATRLAALLGPRGIHDVLGLVAHDPEGRGVCLSTLLFEPWVPTKAQRVLYGCVATHVAAGLRLLHATTAEPEAILDGRGKVVHAEEPAKAGSAREVLRHAAKAVDRARGRLRRDDPAEALELWRGLVDGRWSLVDRFESDGRRYVVARRNDPDVRDPRALTARERQVAGYVAAGHSNKLVAYSLGLSTSAVNTHLTSAKRKLGVRTRTELIAMLATLTAPPKA